MTAKHTIYAQLPTNAHLDVPEGTPMEKIASYSTTRGFLRAVQQAKRAASDYWRSRGNMAAIQLWVDGEMVSLHELELRATLEGGA